MTTVANLRLAIDLRNRIIQGYDSVDDEIGFTTVMQDMPSLKHALKNLLDERG